MKKTLVLTAAMFIIGSSLLTSAMAQTRAAITQDRDQAGRNYFYAQSSCNQVTFQYCSVTFPTPPAGKRLIVTHVSMLNLMPAANTITSIDLRYLNGAIIAFLNSQVNPGTSAGYNYTTNEAVFAKFDAGETPQVLTFTTGSANFTMVATIAGYMIDIP